MSDRYNILRRLEEAASEICQIKELLKVPSISFGIVHGGKVSYRQCIGHRDANQKLEANEDTIYMLGSITKTFTSAAVGILVDEGKLQWLDPIQKYLPEFDPQGDPRIGECADLIDILRHSTGITPPQIFCIGPRNSIITDEEDLIPLLNLMPTADDRGQRFNREWIYNNYTYGLMALVVERVTGERFADFIQRRILQPLGMTRTAFSKADITSDDNIAAPCTNLESETVSPIESGSWPCENHSPLLAGTGAQSSLNDMLTWCVAVLSAELQEEEASPEDRHDLNTCSEGSLLHEQTTIKNNPLRQMRRIRRGYWTRPNDDPSTNSEAAYCMGWARIVLPTSMLGAISGNQHSRDKGHQEHLNNILGRDSNHHIAVGHSGGMMGSVATLWTFPETQSAVVAMTNGRDLGDAADFAAQILIQALFDLKPAIDLIPWVKLEAELSRRFFNEKLLRPWEDKREVKSHERCRIMYAGEYRGFNNLFTLAVVTDEGNGRFGEVKMSLRFNKCEASEVPLLFFRTDTYSFLPDNKNYWEANLLFVRDYRQSLLEFTLNNATGKVQGLWWLWNVDEPPAWLPRVK